MSQQNENFMNSSNSLPTTTNNENDLKRRDLDDDRDTGDIENNKLTTTTKREEFNDKANKIIQNGIDKSKNFLASIKGIFKLWRLLSGFV